MVNAVPARWQLFVDGASRNNPGEAGAGIYLRKNDQSIVKQGFYLGIKSNNQAEYLALLLGLHVAERHMNPGELLIISSDSQLLVKQILGEYSVKHPELKILMGLVQQKLQHLNYAIRHVLRNENAIADHYANMGIDKRLPVPQEFLFLIT